MIYDKLENIETYAGISPRVMQGLKALRDTDFSKLEDGRYELDGKSLYMNVSTYETKEANENAEAHRQYIDIQYLISGEELIGVAPLDEMGDPVEEKTGKDAWMYVGKTDNLLLSGSRFMVLYPQDAHAPGIAVGKPSKVRKAVVKVLA